jgi:cyclopropane fatty-acyl-phospholipid synthase-like methyltransferase
VNSSDPADFANTEQAEFWSNLAPTWIELEDQLEEVSGPPGELAMDRLGLLPGQQVIDLGCGSGGTTLELAARVSPDGEVTEVDISAAMLARTRDRATRLGAIEEALRARVQDGEVRVSRGVLLVTGRA